MNAQPRKRVYDLADKHCDVVLKGGVTSGIVYPLALCELATKYQFKGLGGTSSGAIVASFAAAAEYYRQSVGVAAYNTVAARSPTGELRPGFVGLEDFADDLKRGDRLFSVFKPDTATKPIFDVMFAGHLEHARGRKSAKADRQPIARTIVALWSNVPKAIPAIAGAVVFAVLLVVSWPMFRTIATLVHEGWRHRLLGDALALLVAIVIAAGVALAALVAGAFSAARLVRREWIPLFVRNGFGLTRGLEAHAANTATNGKQDEDGAEPYSLTTWMTRIINELAGRSAVDAPLTMGDLWSVAGGAGAEPTVKLEMITTCLTLARPLRLPHDLDRDLPCYFDPDEWRAYFPVRVVKWLKEHSPEPARYRDPATRSGPHYYRLPPANDLPVVVATRLSVALPVVLSAVPLWSVNRNTRGARDAAAMRLERLWFSDGGLGSNFPIHFFDELLPRWPTFGIDLRDDSDAYPLNPKDESENVWMPLTNEQGRTEWWNHFANDRRPDASITPDVATRSLVDFAGAIGRTLWSWRDNTLAHEAGFRDRIAHVKLDSASEGGLNLDMPSDIICRLIARGGAAGELLRHRYTLTEKQLEEENAKRRAQLSAEQLKYWRPTTVSWENHRWVRFRASMAALQEALELMNTAYTVAPGYAPLVNRKPGDPPFDFQWSVDQRQADPVAKTQALLDALRVWRTAPAMQFNGGELPPRRPELRMSPRV